ncbi:sensor histidine kinase [Bacillus infantis]|uniref:sensor histidine kinase n=1 Tax=Bacillus infantis TaxID=324767 RepID=UPI001F11545B|nr:histidine kinase [Bacillus infantis]
MFSFFIFLSVLCPIICMVMLFMLKLIDQELDYLELENVRVKLEKELQESEYNQLNQRIQPHFLFNALNAFLSLTRIGRYEEMMRGMERFSLFLRYKYQEKDVLVPFYSELKHTENYVSIQQLRFGRRLQVTYEISPLLHHVMIPPYTLQTLVENAFKHGLEKKAGDKILRISFVREGNWVCIRVIDNGTDPIEDHYFKNGVGLDNINRRFQLLFDLRSELSLIKNKEGQTVAKARWPYIPGDEDDEIADSR